MCVKMYLFSRHFGQVRKNKRKQEEKRMRKSLAVVLAAAMAFSLAGCGGSSSTATQAAAQGGQSQAAAESQAVETSAAVSSGKMAGGMTAVDNPDITTEGKSEDITVTISSMVDITGISAFAAPQSGRNDIRYLIYDQLAIMAKPGGEVDEMAFQMAKNIEKVDNDTYKIEIYDYIHDWAGNPITADDVIFSYTTMADSGVSGKFSRLFDSMEKVDDYNLILRLKNTALGTAQYVLQFCPVVSQKAYESQSEGERAQYPIGTGGYKIVDYVSGGYCYLERVDDYWQTDESLRSYAFSGQAKEIKIIIQTEAAQRANALTTGSVDVVPIVASTDIGLFRNEDGTAKDGYNVLSAINGTTYYLPFNCNEVSPLSNIELRKAVSYAIDSVGVMDGTFGKNGYLASKDCANALLGDYNAEWNTDDFYDYNIDKAKECLEKSGAKDVTIKMMTSTEDAEKAIAVFVQQYLAQIGINVEINSYDSALITEYKNDPTMWDIRVDAPGSSDYCADAWNLTITSDVTGLNSFMVVDEKYDELVKAAGGIDTHSAETVEAVHDYAVEQCYYIPLGNYYKYSAATDKLQVWPLHPYNYLLFGGFIFE